MPPALPPGPDHGSLTQQHVHVRAEGAPGVARKGSQCHRALGQSARRQTGCAGRPAAQSQGRGADAGRSRPADPLWRARMRLWTMRPDAGVHRAIGMSCMAVAFRHQILARGPEQVAALRSFDWWWTDPSRGRSAVAGWLARCKARPGFCRDRGVCRSGVDGTAAAGRRGDAGARGRGTRCRGPANGMTGVLLSSGHRDSARHQFVQSLDDLRQHLRRAAAEAAPDPLDGERADLADLDPRALGQLRR